MTQRNLQTLAQKHILFIRKFFAPPLADKEKKPEYKKKKHGTLVCKTKISPPVGLEPTTFELEVQHASPLRHGGFTLVP